MTTATTTQENKELVRRALDASFNRRDYEALREALAEDFVGHAPSELGHDAETQDRDRLIEEIERNTRAFPDLVHTVEEIIAEGDTVAVRWTARGTHDGELMGMPPTGTEVTLRGMNFFHVEDGQITEDWVLWDALGLMQQLGIAPDGPLG